jgi:hypothetical protein
MKRSSSRRGTANASLPFDEPKAKKKNALLWLLEPLQSDPAFFQKKLFSFDAAYLENKLYVAVKDGIEPWDGLLVCTAKQHHAALCSEFPQLAPHPVVGKWLYLPQSHPDFEPVAQQIVSLVLDRDPRLGVDTGTRRRK